MNCIEMDTPLGSMLIADRGDGLAGLWFADQRHLPPGLDSWPRAETALLASAREQLGEFFAGRLQCFDLPLAAAGTIFQQAVWRCLQTIPYGARSSYGQIAESLGKPSASRAVGMAVGRNPWSIVVPCHRVVGSDGQLTGYAGGLERKRWLLALEAERHHTA
ncbi:MAG: methylated-DNA--[protein]-cysteine S-methyltransferase [Wenzhouxiangella sp.]|nr:MAG: methylated-DNA--[protein]-cysteine S-methyltransferase [Wenzhouxiangella sp.]